MRRGRPSNLPKVSDEIRAKIAVSVSSHHVALRNVCKEAHLWLSDSSPPHTADGVSVNLVMPIVMNVYTRVFESECEKVAKSSNLSVSIDGTSDVNERNPIAIHLAGVHNLCPWSLPFHFCEPRDHKPVTQLHEIKKMLKDVNMFNEVSCAIGTFGYFFGLSVPYIFLSKKLTLP